MLIMRHRSIACCRRPAYSHIFARRDVIRGSARQEFEAAKDETDPEIVGVVLSPSIRFVASGSTGIRQMTSFVAQITRLLVSGRDSLQQALQKV